MTPEVALEYINAALPTGYTIVGPMPGHEQSAFRVKGADGSSGVLKLSDNPMWQAQIERARMATGHMRPLGYPVPTYLHIGSNNTGTYWLESWLPGQAVDNPTPEQTTDLLRLIELQKGQNISELQGQDWSWYAAGVVFRGDSGLVRSLMQYSTETSALAAQIEGMVLGLDSRELSNSDLVHGDLSISQVLIQGQAVSGVVDWDQVGYGDRTMDLVSLWYSLMDVPAARDQVFAAMRQGSDPESIKIFAAYKMLATVAWSINKAGGEVANDSQRAKTAISLLMTLR